MENNMDVPQKTQNRTVIWCANPTSGYISKGNVNKISKRLLHSLSLQHYSTAKLRKQPKGLSINQWLKKMLCIPTMERYSAMRRKEILLFVTCMRAWRYYAKRNKPDRKRQIMSLACSSPRGCKELDTTWQLKNNKSFLCEILKKEEEEAKLKETASRKVVSRGGINRERLMKRCIRSVIRQCGLGSKV